MIYDRNKEKLYEYDNESPLLLFLYKNIVGRIILKFIVLSFISKLNGLYTKTKFSKRKISNFTKKYDLQIEDINKFQNFNDFFTRKQNFEINNNNKLISVAESLLSIYTINEHSRFTIKNQKYALDELLNNEQLAKEYIGGHCLIFRLEVSNYHRYCYFDEGEILNSKFIKGVLHTVRPLSYEKDKPLIKNTRNYSLLKTDNYDQVVFMEVGAILVGKFNINSKTNFNKGDERGYFELGGSTVVLLFKKDLINFDKDITKFIDSGVEIKVQYAEEIGEKNA